eukprot:589354-Amphidinium_carterae.1
MHMKALAVQYHAKVSMCEVTRTRPRFAHQCLSFVGSYNVDAVFAAISCQCQAMHAITGKGQSSMMDRAAPAPFHPEGNALPPSPGKCKRGEGTTN